MKIKIQTLLILIMLAGLNGSCSADVLVGNSPMPSLTIASPSIVQSATPTLAVTDIPLSQTNYFCWPVKTLQEGNDIRGSLVYHLSLNGANSLLAWDLSSFHDEKLDLNKRVNTGSDRVSFSGDTVEMLADNDLVFISHKGLQSFPLPDEAIVNDSILTIKNEYPRSDGRVLISRFGSYREIDNDYVEGVGFTYMFYMFDPKTDEISKHELFLPDFYMDSDMVPHIYFSPSMKYILYKSTPTKDNPDRFDIYDIEKEEVVMTIPPQDSNLNVTSGEPHWLPNDDIVTAEFQDKNTNSRDYYFLSLDGKILPVTNLPDYVSISSGFLGNPLLNWSPNGRYLVSTDIRHTMYIWDNDIKMLYAPCLPNEQRSIIQPQPIWSFDGNYFVATLIFPSLATPIVTSSGQIVEQRIVKRYILDLGSKVIYEMPENVNKDENDDFLGWVNWELP